MRADNKEQDLSALQDITIEENGKKLIRRREKRGSAGCFRVGVVVPATIREVL